MLKDFKDVKVIETPLNDYCDCKIFSLGAVPIEKVLELSRSNKNHNEIIVKCALHIKSSAKEIYNYKGIK